MPPMMHNQPWEISSFHAFLFKSLTLLRKAACQLYKNSVEFESLTLLYGDNYLMWQLPGCIYYYTAILILPLTVSAEIGFFNQ